MKPPAQKKSSKNSISHQQRPPYSLRRQLGQWQEARTWAMLIREVESLWNVRIKEIKRIGAIELTYLLNEVPRSQRGRVDRWLNKYSALTRFKDKDNTNSKRLE